MYVILNFVCFQALWLSCVLGAGGYGLHWLAGMAVLPLLVLAWFSAYRQVDLVITGLAVAIGYLLDNVWVANGILSYPGIDHAPYWIGLLWLGLGLTINHSMRWFRDQAFWGALIVGAFAPVTYISGQGFGAVTIEQLPLTAFISVSWCILFYCLAHLSKRLIQRQDEALTVELTNR